MIRTWLLLAAWVLAWLIWLWYVGAALRRLVWRWLRRKSSNQVEGVLVSQTRPSRNSEGTSVARYRFTDHKGRVRRGRQYMDYAPSITFETGDAVEVTYCRYAPSMNFLTAYGKDFVGMAVSKLAFAAVVAAVLFYLSPQFVAMAAVMAGHLGLPGTVASVD